jgi:hypothetical protein
VDKTMNKQKNKKTVDKPFPHLSDSDLTNVAKHLTGALVGIGFLEAPKPNQKYKPKIERSGDKLSIKINLEKEE